jgi:hypothetical protein
MNREDKDDKQNSEINKPKKNNNKNKYYGYKKYYNKKNKKENNNLSKPIVQQAPKQNQDEYIIKKIITIDTGVPPVSKYKNSSTNTIPIKKEIFKKKFKINSAKEIDIIDFEINNIEDLIKVGKLYLEPEFKTKNYSANIKGIYEMIPALEELNSMIGITEIKKDILEFIIYFSQNLHTEFDFTNQIDNNNNEILQNPILQIFNIPMASQQQNIEYNHGSKTDNFLEDDCKYDMKHIVIYGPPGSGKTLLGRILAKISLHLGISSNDKFIIAKRADLIGEFLGMTAIKTQKMIDKAIGGTLFIDEAYSLGSSEKDRDIYAKECIDTLNQNLTEKKGQFQCIIAGYEEELEKNFFSLNPGLKRRFPFKYKIEKYTSKELLDILILKINKINWIIKTNIKNSLYSSDYLKNKMEYFEYYGGDIETWLFNIKIEHGKRVFGKHPSEHQIITREDIDKGFERYKIHKKLKKNMNLSHLYI